MKELNYDPYICEFCNTYADVEVREGYWVCQCGNHVIVDSCKQYADPFEDNRLKQEYSDQYDLLIDEMEVTCNNCNGFECAKCPFDSHNTEPINMRKVLSMTFKQFVQKVIASPALDENHFGKAYVPKYQTEHEKDISVCPHCGSKPVFLHDENQYEPGCECYFMSNKEFVEFISEVNNCPNYGNPSDSNECRLCSIESPSYYFDCDEQETENFEFEGAC